MIYPLSKSTVDQFTTVKKSELLEFLERKNLKLLQFVR